MLEQRSRQPLRNDTAPPANRVFLITGASSGIGALEDGDIARAVLYAASEPPHVIVKEIPVRPTAGEG
jgi:NADP-dependent 3-hydroxy acid dehydrogenase YdfG